MITEYIQPLLQDLHQHPWLGQFVAFLISFAESLPLIGTIIPGSITMTAIGTLIGTGIIPGFITLAFASLGALAGDCIGFYMGVIYKDKLRTMWPFRQYPQWLAKSENFLEKHGGKSIIIGRFIGPARSTVPLVAGLLGMPAMRFFLAAIPSAVLWAVAYTLPGILIGAVSLELPPSKAAEFLLTGAVFIVALWFMFWFIQFFFVNLVSFINQRVDYLWNWLCNHHSSKLIIRWITNQLNPNDHHQLNSLLLSLLLFTLFLLLFIWILFVGPHNGLNLSVFHLLQSIRHSDLDKTMVVITMIGYTKSMLATGIFMCVGLYWKQQYRAANHFLGLLITLTLMISFFKHFAHSPRPTGFNVVNQTFSFPSGHTAMSLAVSVFAAFLTSQLLEKPWRWTPYFTAILFTILVAFSRIYLGAHWLTDITGSMLLSTAIVLITIVNYRRMPKQRGLFSMKKRIWFSIIFFSVLIPFVFYFHFDFAKESYRYTPVWPIQITTLQQWWKQPQQYLPMYRHNRLGQPIQPFNIQWTGSLNNIEKHLRENGWQTYDKKLSFKSAVSRFVSYKTEYHMPLWPWLYHGKPPVLTLIKPIPNSTTLVELRLWRTKVTFTDSDMPMWIGSINYHIPPKKLLGLPGRYQIIFKSDASIEQLLANLKNYQDKVIHIPYVLQPDKVQRLDWSGDLLLLKPRRH